MRLAQQRILALVSGLSPREREARQIMILQPFADDSGSDPQSHTFVLGGLVATPEEWVSFTADWETALDGPIKIDYFKMSEAMAFEGQFEKHKGWSETSRNKKIGELVEIITGHLRYGARVSMRHADFRKYIQGIPLPSRNLTTDLPYMFLFTQFVLMLCEHARRHNADCTFDFVFDTQTGLDVEAVIWWPYLKAFAAQQGVGHYMDAAPRFCDEKKMLPLQAADLFAWEHRNYLVRNKTLIVPPSRFLSRLNSIPTIRVDFPAEALATMNSILMGMAAAFAEANPTIEMLPAGKKSRARSKVRLPPRRSKKGSKGGKAS